MVKKIFYWSPYLGRVATIRAVINSMIGLSNLRKNKCNISIINCYGEWDNQTINFRKNNINIIDIQKKLNLILPPMVLYFQDSYTLPHFFYLIKN